MFSTYLAPVATAHKEQDGVGWAQKAPRALATHLRDETSSHRGAYSAWGTLTTFREIIEKYYRPSRNTLPAVKPYLAP